MKKRDEQDRCFTTVTVWFKTLMTSLKNTTLSCGNTVSFYIGRSVKTSSKPYFELAIIVWGNELSKIWNWKWVKYNKIRRRVMWLTSVPFFALSHFTEDSRQDPSINFCAIKNKTLPRKFFLKGNWVYYRCPALLKTKDKNTLKLNVEIHLHLQLVCRYSGYS